MAAPHGGGAAIVVDSENVDKAKLRDWMAWAEANAIESGVEVKTGGYTVDGDDRSVLFRCTATLTLALTAAATLGDGFLFAVVADGGVVTIDPSGSETINGATTLVLNDGDWAEVVSDGTGFYAQVTRADAILQSGLSDTADLASTTDGVDETPAKRGLVADYVQVDRTQMLHVRDEKTSGTNGGTFTAGAWQTRALNTVKVNDIAGASLASNQITLPAGTYFAEARAPAYNCASHAGRLYDTTGAAELLAGSAAYASGSQTDTVVRGQFTLSVESVVELQHRCSSTAVNTGLGADAAISGFLNVFAEVVIRRVA